MKEILVKVLWDDLTGQYCSEVSIDGQRKASFYDKSCEQIFVGAINDKHCRVTYDQSRVTRARNRHPVG